MQEGQRQQHSTFFNAGDSCWCEWWVVVVTHLLWWLELLHKMCESKHMNFWDLPDTQVLPLCHIKEWAPKGDS